MSITPKVPFANSLTLTVWPSISQGFPTVCSRVKFRQTINNCFIVLKKRKRLSQMRDETRLSGAHGAPLLHGLKRPMYGLLQDVLSCRTPPRSRDVWMHPHLFASFDVVREASFPDLPDKLWSSNFRATLGTFTYIHNVTGDEISRQDIPMRKAVRPNRRL